MIQLYMNKNKNSVSTKSQSSQQNLLTGTFFPPGQLDSCRSGLRQSKIIMEFGFRQQLFLYQYGVKMSTAQSLQYGDSGQYSFSLHTDIVKLTL